MNNKIKVVIVGMVLAGLVGCERNRDMVVTLCEEDQTHRQEYYKTCMASYARDGCLQHAIRLSETCKDYLVQDKDEADGMKKAIDLIKKGIEE